MLIPHALAASLVEGLVTALVVGYLQRANQPALEFARQAEISSELGGFPKWRAMWVGLAVMLVLAPVGLLAPGTAWGEWSTHQLSGLGLAFIPQGMASLSGLWSAPLPGYALPVLKNASLGYILAGMTGVIVIGIVAWLFTLLVTARKSGPK